MCSTSFTTVVTIRSNTVVIRPSISSGFKLVYEKATAITGMSTLGKMSVGVRKITMGLSMRINNATTTKVYGRRRATFTIHIPDRMRIGVGAIPDFRV